jgi:hypothetical protein
MLTSDKDFNADDEEMNKRLYFHLKKLGMAFPDSAEDLEYFMEHVKRQNIIIPKDLPSPEDIFSNGFLSMKGSLNDSLSNDVLENLAQAAREGGNIPPEVIKTMEEDRKKSEEQGNNEQSE